MTAQAEARTRIVGVGTGLWSVAGAAAPTLVVTSARRIADPLPVLETAVASVRRPVTKVALTHPARPEHPADAEYVFAQVVERGGERVLDLTPECGHSMIAAGVHLYHHGDPAARSRPLRLSSTRSAALRIVTCDVTAVDAATALYRSGLRFPLDASSRAFPMGREPVPLHVLGHRLQVSVVDSGNPYAFVDARGLGIASASGLMAAGERVRAVLQGVRAQLGPRLGLGGSQVLPKPAVLLHGSGGELYVKTLSTDRWHPGIALTGLVAVAALVAAGSRSDGGEVPLVVRHPGGTAVAALRPGLDGVWSVHVTGRPVRGVELGPPGWRP